MSISLSNLNEILQKDYMPGFTAQLNEEMSYFYKLMEKEEQDASETITHLVTYGRSAGIGSRAEDDDLPVAGAAKRKQITITPKNFFARFSISDRLMKTSANGAAFINALDLEMSEILRDSKDALNRQLFGDGVGTLTTISTANSSAGTTITVADTKYLQPGMKIDILSSSGTAVKSGLIIQNVDDSNGEVLTDVSTTTTKDDIIVTAGSYNKEITGLAAIMKADNTIWGVNRTNNKWFNPNVIDATDETHNDDLMEKCIQKVDFKAGKQPDVIVAGYTAYRSLKNYLSTYQRYIEITTRYDAGHTTLSYNGIPVEQDKYEDERVMDFLKMDTFKLVHIGKLFDWLNAEGGTILRPVQNKAAYEGSLASYCDIICLQPSANLRLKNIGITS